MVRTEGNPLELGLLLTYPRVELQEEKQTSCDDLYVVFYVNNGNMAS